MKQFVKKSIPEKAESVAHLLKIDITSKDNRYNCNYKEVNDGLLDGCKLQLRLWHLS